MRDIQFWIGLILALIGAGMIFFGVGNVSVRVIISILGLILIATSKKKEEIKKMKLSFTPKTKLGKWSVGLIISFFVFLGIFFMFINLGERGGETFFSNLKLTIPFCLAAISAIASFFTGIISILKNKERSILVFLTTLLGFLILLWCLAEILFPH